MPTDPAGPAAPAPLRIERFDPTRHDRDGFDCGTARLDNYLKRTARKQQADDMTRIYVAVAEGTMEILGYSAINLGMMTVDELAKRPRGTPAHGELPILFLGQIAVSRRAQGQGIGSILMHHVFEKTRIIADQAGCFALVLDVLQDGGEQAFRRRHDWYADFGFQPFASNPARMFMTVQQIRRITD